MKTEFEKIAPAIFRIKINDYRVPDSLKLLCISDAHIDNKHANIKLLKKHLNEAVKENAFILFNGDTFCAMQGKWDKRADQTQLRPELQGNNYLDLLVKYVADFLSPYANRILILGHGNHETSIEKHHQTNLLDRLRERLKTEKDCVTQVGGYANWVQIRTSKASSNMLMYHGCGSNAFVTKGSTDMNRIGIGYPDASVIWVGHKHNEFSKTEPRYRLSSHGVEYKDEQLGFMTPGYKEHDDTKLGWEIERLPNPKPIGAAWLEYKLDADQQRFLVSYQRAK